MASSRFSGPDRLWRKDPAIVIDYVQMKLGKRGSSSKMPRPPSSRPITDLAHTVLHHMLQAIDCLAIGGIIHRDVKPENILYVSHQGQYHFQLGDFGFSHRAVFAATFAGSPLYMAPEMFRGGKQTHKVDVWSLYVTMLWTLDVEDELSTAGPAAYNIDKT